MKTILSIETARPITIHELNEFLSGISHRVPGCFVSQGPSGPGRVQAVILSPKPIALEIAEDVLNGLPHLCDAITDLSLQQSAPRSRVRPPAADPT